MASTTNPRRTYEEYSTLEYLLLGDLRAALEEIEDESSHRWLIAVLDALLEALPRKPATLRTVSEAFSPKAPSVSKDAVETLCSEQRLLRDALADLRAQSTDARQFLAQRSAASPLLRDWMQRLVSHNERLDALIKPLFESSPAP